jgi:hypothetical protein
MEPTHPHIAALQINIRMDRLQQLSNYVLILFSFRKERIDGLK